jgi:hypothetical protein
MVKNGIVPPPGLLRDATTVIAQLYVTADYCLKVPKENADCGY